MSTQVAAPAPICPTHRQVMTHGNYGWYCPVKVGVGLPGANAKGYCTYQIKDAVAAPAPAPAAPVVSNGHPDPLPAFPSDAQIAAAALDFAARIYNGAADPETAIACAVRAFQAMKGVVS